ncbi:unnamed protein product [Ectocarpus sp. CCAP 1310/34]|nr:unnamed protein product [Ectocarpus sp. CCAP 1310/34]
MASSAERREKCRQLCIMAVMCLKLQCDMWAATMTHAADQESEEDDFLDHTARTRTSVEPISNEEGTDSSKKKMEDIGSGKRRKRARKSSTTVAKRTRGRGAEPGVKAAKPDEKTPTRWWLWTSGGRHFGSARARLRSSGTRARTPG